MLLTNFGHSLEIDGIEYYIGMAVMAQNCMHAGMKGIITEIRTGGDLETDNPGPDIYCSFHDNGYIKDCIGSIPYEINVDQLIMAPEMLKPLHMDNEMNRLIK